MPMNEQETFLKEAEDQNTLDFSEVDTHRSYFPSPMDEEMMRDLRDKQVMAGIEGGD